MAKPADIQDDVVLFETTYGEFVVETYPNQAPITVANFLSLVNNNFYEGIIFHRVIDGFVIQAGGYDSNMRYMDSLKTIKNESDNGLSNTQRTLSMARTNDPHSASSQFFVNLDDNLPLDYQDKQWGYAVFAKVIGGWSVCEKIGRVQTQAERPIENIVMEKVSVVARESVADLLD